MLPPATHPTTPGHPLGGRPESAAPRSHSQRPAHRTTGQGTRPGTIAAVPPARRSAAWAAPHAPMVCRGVRADPRYRSNVHVLKQKPCQTRANFVIRDYSPRSTRRPRRDRRQEFAMDGTVTRCRNAAVSDATASSSLTTLRVLRDLCGEKSGPISPLGQFSQERTEVGTEGIVRRNRLQRLPDRGSGLLPPIKGQ